MSNTEKNHYEITFIFPQGEEDFSSCKEKISKIFNDNKVEVVREKNLGIKEFAYLINKLTHGHYYTYYIKAEGKVLKTLTKEIGLIEEIIRHMIVHLDKKALRYFEKQNNKEKNRNLETATE